jgi:transcriptional regulator with XRE-family HTH domain
MNTPIPVDDHEADNKKDVVICEPKSMLLCLLCQEANFDTLLTKRTTPLRADRLKEIRELRRLSQRELAARCSMGEKQIWRYENEESNPTSDHVVRIARELDVSSDYLLGLADEPGLHFRESELSPMERKLITAVRHGLIVEALETITTISKGDDQPTITSAEPAINR